MPFIFPLYAFKLGPTWLVQKGPTLIYSFCATDYERWTDTPLEGASATRWLITRLWLCDICRWNVCREVSSKATQSQWQACWIEASCQKGSYGWVISSALSGYSFKCLPPWFFFFWFHKPNSILFGLCSSSMYNTWICSIFKATAKIMKHCMFRTLVSQRVSCIWCR